MDRHYGIRHSLQGKREGFVGTSNRIAGIFAGVYFFGVFLYLLFTAVIPLTSGGGWRGVIDVIAVGFYLAGVVPLGGIALLDLGLIGKHLDERGKLKWHATFVSIFLIVAHIAMIAGMLDPQLSGWKADGASMHKGH